MLWRRRDVLGATQRIFDSETLSPIIFLLSEGLILGRGQGLQNGLEDSVVLLVVDVSLHEAL